MKKLEGLSLLALLAGFVLMGYHTFTGDLVQLMLVGLPSLILGVGHLILFPQTSTTIIIIPVDESTDQEAAVNEALDKVLDEE